MSLVEYTKSYTREDYSELSKKGQKKLRKARNKKAAEIKKIRKEIYRKYRSGMFDKKKEKLEALRRLANDHSDLNNYKTNLLIDDVSDEMGTEMETEMGLPLFKVTSSSGLVGMTVSELIARKIARKKAIEKGLKPGTKAYRDYLNYMHRKFGLIGSIAGMGTGLGGYLLYDHYKNKK